MKYTINNIKYHVLFEELIDFFDNITSERAAELLEIPVYYYNNMTTSERHSYIMDCDRSEGWAADILNLPETIEFDLDEDIRKEEITEADIADAISEITGYYVSDWNIKNIENS